MLPLYSFLRGYTMAKTPIPSLKTQADYRGGLYNKNTFVSSPVQLDWLAPVLHYKEKGFWAKLHFVNVNKLEATAEPGGKADAFGRLKIQHIIKLHTQKLHYQFIFSPDDFQDWLYWIIRSLLKHSGFSVTEEAMSRSGLKEEQRLHAVGVQNLSDFEKAHAIFVHALNGVSDSPKHFPHLVKGAQGSDFITDKGKFGGGGTKASIHEIIQDLKKIQVDGKTRRTVAMKILDRRVFYDSERQAIIQEARIMALLGKHPNIVGFIDTAFTQKGLCLFMEKGITSLDKPDQSDLPAVDEIYDIAQGILTGIAHMHKLNTYHMDMKPANVILCNGELKRYVPKIIDFGSSRSAIFQHNMFELSKGQSWCEIGTKGYICPEFYDLVNFPKQMTETDLLNEDSFAVGMTLVTGLLVLKAKKKPLEKDVAVHGGQRANDSRQRVEARIDVWSKWLRRKDIFFMSDPKLERLAKIALDMINPNPEKRLTVAEALYRSKQPWPWEPKDRAIPKNSGLKTVASPVKPLHKIVYSLEQLQQSAGHGNLRKVKIRGLFGGADVDGCLEKSTSGVEAHAYVRLIGSELYEKGYLPKIKMIVMNGIVYDFIDPETRDQVRKEFLDAIRGKKLGAEKDCRIVIEDFGYTMKRQWKVPPPGKLETIDIKIGTRIFDDDELKMNGRSEKNILNKAQMKLSVYSAGRGGASGYQVADGKLGPVKKIVPNIKPVKKIVEGFGRQIHYVNTFQNIEKFMRGMSIKSRERVFDRLSDLKNALKASNVCFIGSSLLFEKDSTGNVDFICIDFDHAVFEDLAVHYPGLFDRVSKSYNDGLKNLMDKIIVKDGIEITKI